MIWLSKHLLFMLIFFSGWSMLAGNISGKVTDADHQPLPGVTLHLEGFSYGSITDLNGHYELNNIPTGTYKLVVSSIGYKNTSQIIQVNENGSQIIDFSLEEDVSELNSVLIIGETELRELKKQPYNLNVIDTRPLQNANLDINQVLSRSTGINVREEGGLGSGFDFSINGLSGKQVKFFLDGVPMDNFGSSYSINNIPVNLVERIEVYKGMVPVSLGADALGGAVNIITRSDAKDYLDAAYSFGSFNTHRTSVNAQYTIPGTEITLQSSAYFNASDNNYTVDVEIPDMLGNLDGTTTSVERFHDGYVSGMFQVKAGIRNKSYADKLLVGLTVSGNKKEVQHGTSIDRVFGQIETRDEIFMPSIEYQKDNFLLNGLSLRSYGSYIDGHSLVIDTSSRTYDWLGNYTIKNNPSIGEAQWEKTLFSFDDQITLTTNNLIYTIDNHQELTFNHTFSRFVRRGEDPLDPNIVPFSEPNYLNKHIYGLAYKISLLDERLSSTAFAKYYDYQGKAIEVDWDDSRTIERTNFNKPGYGLAGTFFLTPGLQVKSSYERTYRLPEGFEMFGNGLLTESNAALQPESSHNVNAGLLFSNLSRNHALTLESNYFLREAENMIRIEATGITSQYVNLANARSSGVEGEVTYKYQDWLRVGANATYQNIINTTKYDEGRVSSVYLDRIPNIPYFFANFSLSLQFKDILGESDRLGINWYTRYIHEYYLKWPSQGDPDQKHVIPEQLIHNLELTYTREEGRYNASLGATNLTDARAFDKFRIQKPGRAFYLKLRYFIHK